MLPIDRPPETIYRIGLTGQVWDWIDWQYAEYGRFNGRWDDPYGNYRMRYAAFDPYAAFVEALQRYRPDMQAVAEQMAIEGEGNLVQPVFPRSWFKTHELGIATVRLEEVEFLDLATGDGIAAAEAAIRIAERATSQSFKDFDARTLMSTDREFTQALGRYVYESGHFAGIVYLSRFAPEQRCVALFETRHDLTAQTTRAINETDSHFIRARRIHRLRLDVPATTGGPT